MTKVAIIIPTMNRPEFLLRQFEFFEFVDSPHPLYVLDSSNEENAEKIVIGIKKFKKLNIVYKWAPPGKDCLWQLMPLIKEKYCIQMGDDDLIVPKTISDCADFLESHPDYATCAGKQVNIRFKQEDYDKPYGLIDRATLPMGRSIEHEDMFVRVKDFWSDPPFICFTVRRTKTERKIRNITKHFSFMDYVTEFIIWSVLIIYGKAKTLDRLGYIMQISDNRHNFIDYPGIEYFMSSSSVSEKWEIVLRGLSDILQELGKSKKEDNFRIAKWIFTLYLIHQFTLETNSLSLFPFVGQKKRLPIKQYLLKRIRSFILSHSFFKKIYYKYKTPQDATRSESKYFNDFKTVRDFLEKNR